MLYELLTGMLPFGLSKLNKGFYEVLRTIREEEPSKPSTRVKTLAGDADHPGRVRPSPAGGTDHPEPSPGATSTGSSMKALEKDRTRRYETANGFAEDVQRYLDGDAVVPRPLFNRVSSS